MTLRGRLERLEDGAATVEMAVLMIIFVPLILFTMYASDAVFHTLEVQEAVVVTMWDLSQQSYSQNPKPVQAREQAASFIDGTVAAFDRLQYADNIGEYASESKIASGGTSFSSDSSHHIQVFGHVCWCNGRNDCEGKTSYESARAQAVHCTLDQGTLHNLYLSLGADYYSLVAGAGGVVTCSAKGWLYNYLIPETFLAGFGSVNKVKLFNKKKQTASDPHSITSSGEGVGGDMLLKFRSQLFVDTWAVTSGSNINRSSGIFGGDGGIGPNEAYFRRAAVVYTNPLWYASPAAKVADYAWQALNKKLLAVPAVPEVPYIPFVGDGPRIGPNPLDPLNVAPDNPLGFTISAKFPVTSTDAGGFYTTPYYDRLRSMYDNRDRFYLGFTQQKKTY